MANQICEDNLRIIASFLSYNDRINMNKCLPKKYQYVKKIDSDAHNLHIKMNLLKHKLDLVEKFSYDSLERIKAVKRTFLYLLHTRDTCLFSCNPTLFKVLREKVYELSDINSYNPFIMTKYRKDINSLMRVTQKLISVLDAMPVPTENKKYKFIEIR